MSARTLASNAVLLGLVEIVATPLPGAVKILVREGIPIVDGVYVNGHGPYRFLVDTGTNVNMIDPGLARAIGMTATFQDELSTPGGPIRIPGADGNRIELGSIEARGQRFLLSKLEAIHELWPDVQGILGQWFLSGFDYRIDLRGKRLEFGKQEVKGSRARLRMHNGRTAVSTSLGDLVLDSGAVRLVLFGVEPGPGDKQDLRTVAGSQSVGLVFRRLIIEGRKIWGGDAGSGRAGSRRTNAAWFIQVDLRM